MKARNSSTQKKKIYCKEKKMEWRVSSLLKGRGEAGGKKERKRVVVCIRKLKV